MRRKALSGLNNKHCEHAGLLLDRGFKKDRGNELHNDDKMQLFSDAQDISISEYYKKAYNNWKQTQIATINNSQIWIGKLINRMYLGMGEASPLEAGITLHHTYGVPFIPGSAIKGVLHHYIDDLNLDLEKDKKNEIKKIIFGEDASTDNKQDSGAAGCLIYNDAWWVPEGKALAPEMITVHAEKYYSNKGKDFIHPDFESPNPNPQIAIQGSFMFSIEGNKQWAEYAMRLLEKALEDMGIGGKTASGYGYFEANNEQNTNIKMQVEEYTEIKRKKDADEAYKNLAEHEKQIKELEKLIETALSVITKDKYSEWLGKATKLMTDIKSFSNEYSEEQKNQIMDNFTKYYEKISWYPTGLKKAKREKQKQKKEEAIANLFK